MAWNEMINDADSVTQYKKGVANNSMNHAIVLASHNDGSFKGTHVATAAPEDGTYKGR